MSFISTTLGRLMPRYRTVAEWSLIYLQIIDAKQVCEKTKVNRRSALVHLVAALGSRTISAVRPHEISAVINNLAKTTPQTAKRVLFECRDLFKQLGLPKIRNNSCLFGMILCTTTSTGTVKGYGKIVQG